MPGAPLEPRVPVHPRLLQRRAGAVLQRAARPGRPALPRPPGRVPRRHRRRDGGGRLGLGRPGPRDARRPRRRGPPHARDRPGGRRPAGRRERPGRARRCADRRAGPQLLRPDLVAADRVRAGRRADDRPAGRPPPLLGRGAGRGRPGAAAARHHQLGPDRGRPRRARAAGVGPQPPGARRGPARAGHRHQALSRAVPRPAAGAVLARGPAARGPAVRRRPGRHRGGRHGAVLPGQPVLRRGRRPAGRGRGQPAQPARHRGPGRALAAHHRGVRRRGRGRGQRGLPVRRAQPGAAGRLGLARLRAPADPRRAARAARRGVRRAGLAGARAPRRGRGPAQRDGGGRDGRRRRPGRAARAVRAAPAPAAAAAVPRDRRLPAGQQGLEPAVRPVAAPARRAGPAPLAAVPRLAGRPRRGCCSPASTSSSACPAARKAQGIDVHWFLGAVVLRDVALLALCAAVVRDVLRPEVDVVRAGGADDPAGGVLAGGARPGPRGRAAA